MRKQTAVLIFIAMQIFLMRSITNLSTINTTDINQQLGRQIPIVEISFAVSTFTSAYGKIFGDQLISYLPFDLTIILIFLLYFFVLIGFLQNSWLFYMISKISHGFIRGLLIYVTIVLLNKYKIKQGFIFRSAFQIIFPNMVPVISILFSDQLIISILIINLLSIVICAITLQSIEINEYYKDHFKIIKLSKQYPETVVYSVIVGMILACANWNNWQMISYIQNYEFSKLAAKIFYCCFMIFVGFFNLFIQTDNTYVGYALIIFGYILEILMLSAKTIVYTNKYLIILLYTVKNFILYIGSLTLFNFYSKQGIKKNYQICILFEVIMAIVSAFIYFGYSIYKWRQPVCMIVWCGGFLFVISQVHKEIVVSNNNYNK